MIINKPEVLDCWLVGWVGGFFGISSFVGYLTPNPFYANSSISINSV